MSHLHMSSDLRVGFVSFGRPTFDLKQAEFVVKESICALKKQPISLNIANELITSVERATEEAVRLNGSIDVLIAQFTTFVDARFMVAMASKLQVPVIAWAIREPNQNHGQRLSLNSLTGANMAGRELHQLDIPFELLYGSGEDPNFDERLEYALRYWSAWKKLHQFKVMTLGETPDGFFFSSPGDQALAQLGIVIENLDLKETFHRALKLEDQDVENEIEQVKRSVVGLETLPAENVLKFAKMMTVLKQDLEIRKADAVAVRCWPEFFTDFGAAACSTISALSDVGIMGACEADILGSLSMDVLAQLTGSASYLGDLVEINEEKEAITFWHCGAGAFSLARNDTGAQAGRHPNRNVGFTLEFGLKPGVVTILRIGEDRDGSVRALVGRGEVLDEPQRFLGTSGVVQLLDREEKGNVLERTTKVIEAGFEPHYAIAYGDAVDRLERLFTSLQIPVTRF